ncbi:MAG TPA: response regulator transcription factor [Candidatus Sulfotelmatobacter sp.]|jgi:DNA-binding response OmpR family regulator|nr:response regulator transcription factor [Candidatus Sulfotelmatobacter sp.]
MHHILIVEDEASLRIDLSDFLTAKGFSTSTAASATEARALLEQESFAAAILDIGLPDGNGFDLLGIIRHRDPNCMVLMLTASGDPDSRVKGLDEGADAYLVKKATLREVEASLRSILRRRPDSGSAAFLPQPETGEWRLDLVEWKLSAPNGKASRLSSNEIAFFQILAAAKGEPVSRDSISQSITRSGAVENTRNLDAVVRRLRRKVNETTDMEAPIRMVYGVGYVLTAQLHQSNG